MPTCGGVSAKQVRIPGEINQLMNRTFLTLLMSSLAGVFALQAQPSLSTEVKNAYNGIKNNILKAAQAMPEADYSFKPVPEIRSFGALVAHIADAQTRFCNAVMGEQKQATAGSKTSKADIVAALQDSIADCDKAFNGLSDAASTETVKMGRMESTKMGAMIRTLAHDNEEYGYMAVYLRLKGITPPSSERR